MSKRKERHVITRKESLKAAIQVLKDSDKPELQEVADKLAEILSEMPCARWTQASIKDSFFDWFSTHGYFPSSRSLDNIKGMPCHGTIKKCFGLTYPQFKEKFLNQYSDTIHILGYGWTTIESLKDIFVSEYERIHPINPTRYNVRRTKGTPTALSIARALTPEGTWDALIEKMGLIRYYLHKPSTMPKGYKYDILIDSPMHRMERYLAQFKDLHDRIDAVFAKYDSKNISEITSEKNLPRETYSGEFETEITFGLHNTTKQ